VRVPILRISGLPFGNPGTKWHLGPSPVARHKIYYKGKVGGFPQVWAMVSLVSLCLPVVHSCTKVYKYALINLLFGLCRSMWVSELLVNLPSPILEFQHAFLPLSVTSQGTRFNSFSFHCFTFGFAVESIKELGGVSTPNPCASSSIWIIHWTINGSTLRVHFGAFEPSYVF
jgi:hypothetical protein